MIEYISSPHFTFLNCAVTVRELPAPPMIEPTEKLERHTAEQRTAPITSKMTRAEKMSLQDPKWILVACLGD